MKESYNDIFNINPKYSTSIAFILGLVLIDNLTSSEQNALGNWLELIAQTIITNSASQFNIENKLTNNININSKNIKSKYNPIIYNIDTIRNLIKDTFPNHDKEITIILKALHELENKIKKINFE